MFNPSISLFAAAFLVASPAFAADYFVVVPVKGRTATAPAESIAVSLQSATLPAAMVGQAYTYNLRDHVLVTGDKALDLNQATLTTADTLPSGLSLASNGMLSGTPTVRNEAGSSFQVTASYKTQTGQQAYTLVVNGAVLQVRQIATGASHTCAVTMGDALKCWGDDSVGQLGDDNAYANKAIPVPVLGLHEGVSSVAAGGFHTCAVLKSGNIKCWGYGNYGQLGNGASRVNVATPIDVQGFPSSVVQIATGYAHTCAVTTQGALYCWGYDFYGQIGNDAARSSDVFTPSIVTGLGSGVASVTARNHGTCALTTSGGAKCWGDNRTGQVGRVGAATNVFVPVDVDGLTSGVKGLSVGQAHTCAVTSAGGVFCWGSDQYGQLGNDTALVQQTSPVPVQGLSSGVAQVAAGGGHSCALTDTAGVLCWGADTQGQLGDGSSLENQPTPVGVAGLSAGVSYLDVGSNHSCAMLTTGGLKCWGQDVRGQLGNDTALTNQPTPVDVVP